MIFHNSILSITRSPGKALLFTLLIFALTLALALSVSVWVSVVQFLEDCDDFYTTIGLFEFMGSNYPDDTAFDESMHRAMRLFDTELIAEDETVKLWDLSARSLGYIDGFWRTDSYNPEWMLSVLVVGNISFSEERNVYSAVIQEELYSSRAEMDTIILIDEEFGDFEPGHFYLVFGEVYYGNSPLLRLRIADYNNQLAAAEGIEVPRMVDITSDGSDGSSYKVPEDSVLLQVAATLDVTNNSVLVTGTDDLMSTLPFHQQELYLVDGRAFTPEEYANGSQVIVITELIAARLGVGVGDTIDLSTAVSDMPGIYNSYWVTKGFTQQARFTVVGIMNTVNNKSWYVYVPKASGVPASSYPVGYTIGQAVIRNEDATEFFLNMEPVAKDRVQLTIYDQGYAVVAEPYKSILTVAQIVTVVCGLLVLAVEILFGFLFVYRQRETSETMRMLGTSKTQVCGYFLYSAGFISLIATAAGAVAGYLLHEGVIMLVAATAKNYTSIDPRYSNGNLTIMRILEFAPDLPWMIFLGVGVVVFLGAVLACLAFILGTFINSHPSQKKASGPGEAHKTSRLNGGSLKFAILSIIRGGQRSMVVPLLSAAVVLFLGRLATTTLNYQEQLQSIYDHTTIKGFYTDVMGKQIGKQVLDAYDVASLYQTGMINALSVSMSKPYYYMGVSRTADGIDTGLDPLYVPNNGFAYESLVDQILRGHPLTGVNNLRTSPEFYYADTVHITFMEGFDESFLTVPPEDPEVNLCIISRTFMDEHSIRLGDTIRVAINQVERMSGQGPRIFRHYDLLVVGIYDKLSAVDSIYTPLALVFDTHLIWEDGLPVENAAPPGPDFMITAEEMEILHSTVLHSATFNLADTYTLTRVKDYLSIYGYSEVHNIGKIREFIVLQDASFNNAVASIKQQIRYINFLNPCLYVLVGMIGFVVSYLLITVRKYEFATIRGLGGTRLAAFASFFFEQSFLCILGTAIGLAAWQIAWKMPNLLHMQLLTGFLICYFLGCAVSIMLLNRSSVLTILLDKD